MYVHRVCVYPKTENIDEVRTMFVERITSRQAQGARAAFYELVAGSNTPQFTVSTLYENLAAFEASREGYRSEASAQAFLAKLASLIREPLSSDLLEVLLPMPG